MAKKLIVIGGGPAGIMAALSAREQAAAYGVELDVELWERNRSLGRKLSITGKGRCNITNDCSVEELVRNIPGNGSFLYSALTRFDSVAAMDFFRDTCGVPLKTERGRRVFPESDQAMDVVFALKQQLESAGVAVCCGLRGKKLALQGNAVSGVYDFTGALHPADAVVVATGGLSYPGTGSTGDGYRLAEQAGHTIVDTRPSLSPLETVEEWPSALSGLSLRNVKMYLYDGDALLDEAFGEMLFAHFGVTGPMVLTLSRAACSHKNGGRGLKLVIDLKPALSLEQMDERLQRDFRKFSRKQYANSLSELLPASLIPVFVELSGIPGDKPVHQLTKEERLHIGGLLKGMTLTVKGPRPISEAIVTAGGVCVREVMPKTMESRLAEGLYFAGEVLDVDGYTGGYNLQAAWASGHAAGVAAAEALLWD